MRVIIIILALLLTISTTQAQDEAYPYPSLSPKGKLSQIIGNTTIEVEYERPSVRNRQIFGALVPWDKVWRTGAGYCTKISFDQDVVVGGQKVRAGKYSLFTIPNPQEWIIILNTDTNLYGSYDYDAEKDAARFIAIPQKTNRFYETLNIDIEVIPNNAKIYISWANTQVSFDIETTTDQEIERLITEELLTKKSKESNIYAGAAEYLLYQDTNLFDALKLADTAIEINMDNGWARSLKIQLYKKMKLYEKALLEIEKYLEYAQSKRWENEEEKENTLNFLALEKRRISELKN